MNYHTYYQLTQSTLKDGSSGVRMRVALIKVYLKLVKLLDVSLDVSEKIKQLLCTIVKISQILYLTDSLRTPKTVLQLYNTSWLHHELCRELIPKPKDRLYGAYFHDLVVHAPPQYQIVCLRSTNAESTEREFSQRSSHCIA